MSEIINRIVNLTESNKITWHYEAGPSYYRARYSCGMHVVRIQMDVYPLLGADGKRIARFFVLPNLLGSNFNDTGPFFDSSMRLIDAIEKQIGKRL